MAKPNNKSIRLSNEVLSIVESSPGNGFNEKFENLVIEYHKTIPKRQQLLEEIEKKIENSRKHLDDLNNKTYVMSKIIASSEQIKNMLESLRTQISNVSQ